MSRSHEQNGQDASRAVATDEGSDRGDPGSLADVEVHTVLSNERRKTALTLLQRNEERTMDVGELAERIAGMETDETPPPRDARKSVYVTLCQGHLPKLDEFGIVDYDAGSKTVALAERAADVSVYLETVPRYGISWSEYYIGVALVGVLLVFASEIGVPLIAAVGTPAWAVLGFLLVGVSAVYRTVRQESSILHRLRDGDE